MNGANEMSKDKIYTFKIDDSFEKNLKKFEESLSENEKIVDTKAVNGQYIVRTELKESTRNQKKNILLG